MRNESFFRSDVSSVSVPFCIQCRILKASIKESGVQFLDLTDCDI